MPARVLPARSDVGTSSTLRPKVTVATAKRTSDNPSRLAPNNRIARSRVVNGNGAVVTKGESSSSSAKHPGANVVEASDCGGIIEILSCPHKVGSGQVQGLILILGTSIEELNARLFHKGYLSEELQEESKSNETNFTSDTKEDVGNSKGIYYAKQAVNAIIASLNNLITAAWKPKSPPSMTQTTISETFSSSRSSSVVSAKKHEGSSIQKSLSSSRTKQPARDIPQKSTTTVSARNVAAILDCFRVAILFLLRTTPSEKSKEIEGIILSVIRKTVALELYDIASYDLECLRQRRYPDAFETQSSTTAPFALNKAYITPESDPVYATTLLEVQALSFLTSLFTLPKTQITSSLSNAMNHPSGPLNAQVTARNVFKERLDVKSIDRYAYTIERAIMRVHGSHSDPDMGEVDNALLFACRSASLQILQTVSDLDQDAFWERVARAGISHFRASADDERKFTVFEEINRLFKELTKRSEKYELLSLNNNSKATGKGLKTFRDTWQHLARKAGSICQRLTSEPGRAEKAYFEALQSVDDGVWNRIIEEANRQPISDLFNVGQSGKDAPVNPLQDTGRLVKVLFELQTFELLRFQKDEKTIFDIMESMQNSAARALPTILELCLESLDSTIHRDEGPKTFEKIMKRLLQLYDSTLMPLRRSRVLLHQLERWLLFPTDEETFDKIDALIANIRDLLNCDDLCLDKELQKYKSQYLATLSLFQAKSEILHSQGSARMIDHIRDALKHVSLLLSAPLVERAEKALPPNRRILRNTSAPRQVKLREPKTPPSQTRVEHEKRYKSVSTIQTDKGSSQSKEEESRHSFDNGEKFLKLLEWALESEVWHGSSTLSVEIARCGRNIAWMLAPNSEAYLGFCSKLISLFISLCQYKQAERVVCEISKDNYPHTETWIKYKLVEAEYYLYIGKLSRSEASFDEASDLLEQFEPREKLNGIQGGLQKIHFAETQAITFRTYAQIQIAKGNLRPALQAAIDSVKHAMKSGTMLSRLCSRSDEGGLKISPFVVQQAQTAPIMQETMVFFVEREAKRKNSSDTNRRQTPRFSSISLANMYWQLVKSLHESYLLVCHIHSTRGSARDAEAFATECIDFDSHANTPALHAMSILQRASLRFQMGQGKAATDDLNKAVEMVNTQHETVGLAKLAILQGDHHFRSESYADANKSFTIVDGILSRIDAMYANGEGTQEIKREILPVLRSLLIRRQAWLLHMTGEEEECKRVFNSIDTKTYHHDVGEIDLLRGKIAIQQALLYLKRDPQLDLVSEATISIPSILKNPQEEKRRKEVNMSPRSSEAGQASFEILLQAHNLFDQVIEQSNRTASTTVREAYAQRMICKTLLSTLSSSQNGEMIDCQIEEVHAITLERELDEILENKLNSAKEFGNSRTVSQKWPRFKVDLPVESSKELPKKGLKKAMLSTPLRKSRMISTDEDSSEGEQQEAPHKAYWRVVHANRMEKDKNTSNKQLPAHWTVVSVSLAKNRNCLLVTRRTGGPNGTQSLYSIPIDRQSRREGEEEDDENCSVDAILKEIREIVEESNLATHSAQNLQSLEARKAWWTQRRLLDTRLKELLATVEKSWLGVFKSVFLETPVSSGASKEALQGSLQEIFLRCCCNRIVSSKRSNKEETILSKMQLDQTILEPFCALNGTEYSDEELEDMVHFVMDAYQCKGIPIAVDEVDMDVCVTDMRTALDAYRNRILQEQEKDCAKNESNEDHHLFLILDKDMCVIPWESIPCLRGKAICRVPSMEFLYDRLHWAPSGHFTINSEKTRLSYILNPSQELIRTQERFQPFLQSNLTPSTSSINSAAVTPSRSHRPSLLDAMDNLPSTPKWKGIVGRAPIMDEFARALESNDIVLYFGHGGAEQYIRVSRLRSLMRCAVTMLWGCSSAVLRDMGEFERYGTPNNYMLAGCPTLVGNLWDATDKELDGISESVMRKFGLIKPQEQQQGQSCNGMSLAKAVAESRDACKLPFLTGAACVVYGIPVYYK